mmetsp:Transcript_3361/g.7782  ORF Transcript_3361/g.7782 Transcript_3361/m.7782 type:complete len:121 (-) Transcript_3361:242-604(-)
MRTAAILIAFASVATAFVPSSVVRSRARVPAPARENVVVQSTFWDGAAPPSQVLGPFLSKQSSSTLGLASLIFLAAGLYSCHTNNVNLPVVTPGLVLGANLTPISWGLHVASWVQKQNGK